MTTRWQFRPPWWAILGTVIGCAITIRLGLWQWHRGLAREALDAQYLSAEAAKPIVLRVDTPVPEGVDARLAIVRGHYDGARQLLLEPSRLSVPEAVSRLGYLQAQAFREIVIAGCEAHVCLLQTALGLLAADLKVSVVADACGSRTARNHELAMQRLQRTRSEQT